MNSNKSLDCLNGGGAWNTDTCQGGGQFTETGNCTSGAYTVWYCGIGTQAGDVCSTGTTKNNSACSSGNSAA